MKKVFILCNVVFCFVCTDVKAQPESSYSRDVLYVKMQDNSGYQVVEKQLAGSKDILPEMKALSQLGWWSKVHHVPDAKLEEWRQVAERNLNQKLPDLRTEFQFHVYQAVNLKEVKSLLTRLADVQEVLGVPLPVKAPVPDFLPQQHYLATNNIGISADSVWTVYNNRGAGIKFCDIEYGFNADHEDFPVVTVLGNVPVDPFGGSGNDHGTAVLGQVVSLNNGWGTTGGASDCQAYFAGANTAEGGYNLSTAITSAMTALSAGDVILLEQQIGGPNVDNTNPEGQVGLVPVEWYKPYYNAIKLAVGNNINVVEAAGNGQQDLDAPEYGTGNGGHHPFLEASNSGAIIVGAGGAGNAMGGFESERARMWFSNYGSRVDLQANGEAVTTTGYGEFYNTDGIDKWYTAQFGGTSSASPIVTDAVILLQSTFKANKGGAILNPSQVRTVLKSTAKPQLSGSNPVSQNIGPLPNVYAAITEALTYSTDIDDVWAEAQAQITPNPSSGIFTISFAKAIAGDRKVQVYNAAGMALKNDQPGNNAGMLQVNLSEQPDGIYFVKIVHAKGSMVKRLVLAR